MNQMKVVLSIPTKGWIHSKVVRTTKTRLLRSGLAYSLISAGGGLRQTLPAASDRYVGVNDGIVNSAHSGAL